MPSDQWGSSFDKFAAWGGGDSLYHTDDLDSLIEAVDYISIHTYPMHDTHYNPVFWGIEASEYTLNKEEQILKAMERARDYAIHQYTSVVEYMHLKGFDKPVHIGETGWASMCNEKYGPNGSKATDEYKSGLYFQLIHEWCNAHNIKCFYFEAFDEQWKDNGNPFGSENHFGLINLNGEVKYALWPMVDNGAFNGLTRDSMPLVKTYKGNVNALLDSIHIPTIVEPAHILH